MPARLITRLLLVPLGLWCSATFGDWRNLTGAETARTIAQFTVSESGIHATLEIYPEDEDLFFSPDGFGLVVTADGSRLQPRIVLREPRERVDRYSPYAGMIDPRTRRRVPGPPDDKQVIYTELHYPLDALPQQLTLVPPLDDDGVVATTVGFLLYHKSAPVLDFRYLSQPETVQLDWDDPWYTAFDNRNLTRHHRWPQMTFLYIEPREVRHESLVRVRDVMGWTQEAPDVHRALTIEEQAVLKAAAGQFFAAKNPFSIDGIPRTRNAYRAEFLNITTRGLQVIEPGATVDASAALLGISESYWHEVIPDSVDMRWELFDERVSEVPTNAIDPAGPYPSRIHVAAPILEWKNYLRQWRDPTLVPVPVARPDWYTLEGLRQAVGGPPDEAEITLVLEQLLRQLAIAYLPPSPTLRDGLLNQLVIADALDDLRPALASIYAISTTGGGEARIEAMGQPTLESITASDRQEGALRLRARWQAQAIGRHWGHVDQRLMGFRVLVDIVPIDGYWKLQGLTVLEARDLGF